MKVKYNVFDVSKKYQGPLTSNEKKYFHGISVAPENIGLTFNKVYTVLGLECFTDGSVNYMIDNDSGSKYPEFYPGSFFEIVEDRISKYWHCKTRDLLLLKKEYCPGFFTFISVAESEYFFDDLIEGRNRAQEIYEEYKELLKNEFPDKQVGYARVIKGAWVECCECDDVWKVIDQTGVIMCLKNGHRNNNPFFKKE